MKQTNNIYENPLITRYASSDMSYIWSAQNKYSTWRRLWVALAKAERNMGLPISEEQIKELESNINNIDFSTVAEFERSTHHEVFAHIQAFAKVCPKSAGIIHIGETSAFVIDNTDIILNRQALELVQIKLNKLIAILSPFALKYKNLATLAFTHLQPAQPTTVGKRACLWLLSLIMDTSEIKGVISNLKLRGVKGTTGTGASFKSLLDGKFDKLLQLESDVVQQLGFQKSFGVTSQIYDRKVDIIVANVLAQIAVSGHKITNDLRILQNFREISESFSSNQVGSSAMPYKRNPILSERVASLAKFVISLSNSPMLVAATQWLERTLDDSANKRLVLPQLFLAVDGILEVLIKIFKNITVHEEVIRNNLNRELPFLVSENILMHYVKGGGDRQEGHEKIKKHAMKAFEEIQKGCNNRLLEYIASDVSLNVTQDELSALANIQDLIGFSAEQVEDFICKEVQPVLDEFIDKS